MLLRRVIEHFKKQEWTAIGIDFVIVVVGVYIGIQAANWNEMRADQSRARGYLERIHADIEADLENYEDKIRFWKAVSEFGRSGLDYADSGQSGGKSQWNLLLAYFQASQVAEFYTRSTTYDELKSSGELHLISDLGLRNALARYHTESSNPALTERPAYRERVRGEIPINVQLYIWEECYASNIRSEQQMRDCPSPISEEEAQGIVDRLRQNQPLMAELRYWMSTMEVATRIGRDRTAFARNVLGIVDAQLNGLDD